MSPTKEISVNNKTTNNGFILNKFSDHNAVKLEISNKIIAARKMRMTIVSIKICG